MKIYPKPTPEAVTAALRACFANRGNRCASWEQIMDCISAQFQIRNWLSQVRGPLQGLINAGEVRRVNGPHVEEYEQQVPQSVTYQATVRNQHGFVIAYGHGRTPESARASGKRVGVEALQSYPDSSWKVGKITVRKMSS